MSDILTIDTTNKNFLETGTDIFSSRENVVKSILCDNGPIVNIIVLAYNRLERTKKCIECVLKYTEDVDYELILIDNGSTDKTLDYFKSIDCPKKKIIRITKNIGAQFGAIAAQNQINGRYVVYLANDIFVTKNWLSNLLKCAMSDKKIGMVTPLATNISNLQDVGINFSNFEEMQKKAYEFNVSNPRLWHERLRLITIATLFKKECLDMVGQFDYGFFHDFVDDDITFRIRRAGYKAILVKDTFVHHAHDLFKEKDPQEYAKSLEKGKISFREKYFGVDAWDDVNNYETAMMSMVNPEEKRGCAEPHILGIDVLCGTPILELKNKLRLADIFDVKLSAYTSDAKYYIDLKTICDGEVFVDRPEYLLEYFGNYKFDCIIIGSPINFYREPYRILNDALLLLKKDGHLFIKLRNTYDIRAFFNILGHLNKGEDKPVYQISLEDLNNHLAKMGYYIKSLNVENYLLDENIKDVLKTAIHKSGISSNLEEAFIKATVRDYTIDIARVGP